MRSAAWLLVAGCAGGSTDLARGVGGWTAHLGGGTILVADDGALDLGGGARMAFDGEPARAAFRDGRIALRRGTVEEWYEARPDALEQGFTVAADPGPGPLRLELVLEGAVASPLPDGARLTRPDGTGLKWAGLAAWDRDGVDLAVRREVACPAPDGSCRLALVVDDLGARYPVVVDPLITLPMDGFDPDPSGDSVGALGGTDRGFSAAISANHAIVGGPGGAPNGSGGVRFLEADHAGWGLGDEQALAGGGGWSVAMDYPFAATGAPGADSVTWWEHDGTDWVATATLTGAAASGFGTAVALDGEFLVVGAPATNSARLFTTLTSPPTRLDAVPGGGVNDFTGAGGFGSAVDVSGPLVAIGSPTEGSGGAVRVYDRSSLGTPAVVFGAAGEQLGAAVSVDGEFVAVGAPGADAVDVYRWGSASGATLALEARVGAPPDAGDAFGGVLALGGLELAVVSTGGGDLPKIHTFERGAGGGATGWGWLETLPQGTDPTISQASLGFDGSSLVYGTPAQPRARFREQVADAWDSLRVDAAALGAADSVGTAVDVDGRWAVVGAPDDGAAGLGVVHVLERTGLGAWTAVGTLESPDAGAVDFGAALALDGQRLVVGDPSQDGELGGAFLYAWDGAAWTLAVDLTTKLATRPASGRYGAAVALAGDLAVVGAPGRPNGATPCPASADSALHVHHRRTGSTAAGPDQWGVSTTAVTDASRLGYAVATDGYRIAASRRCGTSAVLVYDPTVAAGVVSATQVASLAETANTLAIDGELLAIGQDNFNPGGLANAGRVAIYAGRLAPALQLALASPAPATGERYGAALALVGNRLYVGASGTDRVYVYDRHRGATDGWQAPETLQGPGSTRYGAAVAADPLVVAVGMPDALVGGQPLGGVRFEERTANVPPHSTADAYAVPEDVATLLDVAANDLDANGDALAPTVTTPPAHGTATPAGSRVRYTPTRDYNGPDSFEYTVGDGVYGSLPALVDLTVTGTADDPVGTPDAYDAVEDVTLVVPGASGLLANDTDADLGYGDDLDIVVTDPPDHGALTPTLANGAFQYLGDDDFTGVDTFQYRACDDAGGCSAQTLVTLTVAAVEDPPDAVGDGPINVVEDTPYTHVTSVLVNDADPDGDPITASIETAPAHAAAFDLQPDGTFSYEPARDYAGSDAFRYVAQDPSGGVSAPVTVALEVLPVNDPPTAVDDAYAASEDQVLAVDAASGLGANDSDPESAATALVYALSSGSGVAIAADGSFTWTPPQLDANGATGFDYRVCDPEGRCDFGHVDLAVAPVNDPPTPGPPFRFDGEEDQPLAGALAATDVDDAAITFVSVDPPAGGGFALAPDGTFDWSPPADQSGTWSFGYRACDDDPDPLLRCSPEVRVDLVLAPVNDAPRATYAGPPPFPEDGSVAGDVTVGALDPEGDTFEVLVSIPPTHLDDDLDFALDPDGSFAYVPAADFAGTDQFSYLLRDEHGATSVPYVAVLRVTPVDDRPVAEDDAYPASEDTEVELGSVLDNDRDVDSAPLVAVLRRGPSQAAAFELRPDGTFRYRPNPGYLGADAFDYAVSADGVESAPATVSLEVEPVNLAPVVVDAAYATAEDVPLVQGAPGLLANATDPDGDPLRAAVVTPPATGSLTVDASGAWAFVPEPQQSGDVTFVWEACDIADACASATATVAVGVENDRPDGADDAYEVAEDGLLVVAAPGVLSNDAGDVEGPVTVRLALIPPAHDAQFELRPDGSFTYEPDRDYAGPDAFTYDLVDADGATSRRTVQVQLEVSPRPDRPEATDDAYTTVEGVLLAVAAPGVRDGDADRDFDDPPPALRVVEPPRHGVLDLAQDGSFTYDPVAGFVGRDDFRYVLDDGVFVSAPAVVRLDVTAGEAPPATGDTGAEECTAVFWIDEDGDGHGAADTDPITACAAPPGWSDLDDDCDDARRDLHPGADEVAFDGIDQDCSGRDFQPTPAGACDTGGGVVPLGLLPLVAALRRRRAA